MISGHKVKNGFEKNGGAINIGARSAVVDTLNGKWKRLAEDRYAVKNLLANRILAALGDGDFARLVLQLQTVSFKSGEAIYQPEGDCKFVYFPETAVFSQMNILENGKTAETAMIGCEGVVGQSSVLGFTPISFWTQTLIAGSAYRMSAKIFSREFVESGLLRTSFFEYLNAYIKQITQRAVCNNHHRIENRFAVWLLMLADRGKRNKLPLTQEQIAAALGVQRPSVTCIAQHLRSTGSIDYARGGIVLNRQKLEEAACECYSVIK